MVNERDDTKLTKKGTVMTSEVEQAESTLATLRQKRGQLVAHGHSLGEDAGKISYSAHTGDQAARKRLDKLNAEITLHDSELRSLNAAIAEATARLEKTRAAEAHAESREVARELIKRAAALVVQAQSLDDANSIRVEASNAIRDELMEMRALAHGLGVFVPSDEQFLALGMRADMTAGMKTPFAREVAEHLPPNQRRDHMSYVSQWRATIAKGCAALLGETEQDNTEAA
jgi:hypothetical protein